MAGDARTLTLASLDHTGRIPEMQRGGNTVVVSPPPDSQASNFN